MLALVYRSGIALMAVILFRRFAVIEGTDIWLRIWICRPYTAHAHPHIFRLYFVL